MCRSEAGLPTAAPRAATRAPAPTGTPPPVPGTRLVWFKHDLRVDDHPGLVAAAAPGGRALCVYVLDPVLAARTSPGPCGAAALAGALACLRSSLRVRGADLVVVRAGPAGAAAAVADLAARVGAAAVYAEEEVVFGWACEMAAATDRLAATSPGTRLITWRAALHERPDAGGGSWRAHARARGARLPPVPSPGTIKGVPLGDGEAGELPSATEVEALTSAALGGGPAAGVASRAFGAPPVAAAAADAIAAGGEAAAQEALAAYLGGIGAAQRARSDTVAAVAAATDAAEAPGTPGGSFPAIFGHALAMGTLSRRRVAAEAAVALARLPPLASLTLRRASTPARAAAAAADAGAFHASLAANRAATPARGGGTLRHWRWRGVLTEYVECAPSDVGAVPLPGSPALLLVHGFGAFGEQFRGQAASLAAAGFRVFAPTYPGYGRSEKPALPYGQDLWAAYLRDFVRSVVRGPVVAAGNSIGGYIVAALAADAPDAVAGLVLLNPAGRVDGLAVGEETGGGAPMQPAGGGGSASSQLSQPPPRIFVEAASRSLFLYLELSISRTLKRLYPTNPGAADAWLAGEIGRAAADPGALGVFQSVFYMPRPRALDVLVGREYGGPTLVLQGVLDPLNDARGRAAALVGACPNAGLQLLDAGHCPHDEAPEAVSAALDAFARKCFGLEEGGGGVAAEVASTERVAA